MDTDGLLEAAPPAMTEYMDEPALDGDLDSGLDRLLEAVKDKLGAVLGQTVKSAGRLVGIALLLIALSGTQTSLCQRMRSVPVYRGLTYWEVQQIAKAAPTSITPCGEDTIRRWVSGRYQIALRFNRYDVCLGVEEEIDG